MIKYNCAIIDDEPLARKILKEYVNEIEELNLLGEFKSALDFSSFPQVNDLDIIFIDINMPKLSGIDFVKNFNTQAHIVFTTAYSEFAADAFDLNATDYLVKPISLERFLKTIQKIKSQKLTNNSIKSWITIKENKRLYKVDIDDLLYFQAYGDYVKIITEEKNYITKSKLSEFTHLNDERIVQVHRSYIVNIEKVAYVEGNFLSINSEKIPVSNSFREALLRKFH